MPLLVGNTSRAVPTLAADGTNTQTRVSQYGDMTTTQMGDAATSLADEGLYFKATSVVGSALTPATATNNNTSFVATTPFVVLQTQDLPGNTRCFLDYIRLYCTATGGTTTFLNFNAATFIDQGRSLGTAGTQYIPVNVNNAFAKNNSYLQVNVGGNITGAATPSVRAISRHTIKTLATNNTGPALAVGDLFSFDFGEHSQSEHTAGNATAAVTAASAYAFACGPVALGRGDMFTMNLWGSGMAGTITFEFEIGWWER